MGGFARIRDRDNMGDFPNGAALETERLNNLVR
jgi:hypothetical protein